MRFATLAVSCALLAACFSKPTFNGGSNGDGGIDAPPIDGPPIDPAAPALIATGGGDGGTGGHACRITDGMLWCWGSNSNGQLARSVSGWTGTPGLASNDPGWTSVATGVLHTCGVRAGEVYCWGQNYYGQSAPGLSPNTTITSTRVVLPGTDAVDRVFAGGFSTCAIKMTGETYCWGDINLMRTVGPSTLTRLGAAGDMFTQVAIANDHACALATDGVAHCWGEAEEQQTGQDGNETFLMFAQVKPIISSERFTLLAAAIEATCGITTSGALVCWGSSNQGQLGPKSESSNGHAPMKIGLDTGWTNVAVGTRHTCGVRGGDVYCFGEDQFGALGDGTFNQRVALPSMKVQTDMTVSQIAASDGYTCALSSDGVTMKCWGSNAKGELGNKKASRKVDPVQVSLGGGALQVVAGDHHTCAIVGTSPGPVYCWGNNGEREAGTTSSQLLYRQPVQAVSSYEFTQIAAGGLHTCGITSDNTLIVCWGDNVSHQLGSTNGQPVATVSTSSLGAGVSWTAVAAGSRMSCGITNTNRLFCWGLRAGSNAIGTADLALNEYAPPTGTWKSISIGSDFAIGVLDSSGARVYSIADPMKVCAANLPDGQATPEAPHEVLSGFSPWAMGFPIFAAAQHNGAHSCMLRPTGASSWAIACFGGSGSNQVGGTTLCPAVTTTTVPPPAPNAWLAPSLAKQTLFTADNHSCALDSTSQLYCWGGNGNAELGSAVTGATPMRINTKTWKSIAGSFQHTCGIDLADNVFCWGENQYGQVGDDSSYEPSPVLSGVP